MDTIAVIFPSADADATEIHPAWTTEVAACEVSSLFFPILYNESAFVDGAKLKVSEPAPSKKTYCIRRGRTLRDEMFRSGKHTEMEHALKRFGYVEALRYTDGHGWTLRYDYPPDHYATRDIAPESVSPYHRHWQQLPHWFKAPEEYVWEPSLSIFRKLLPAVVKNDDSTFCHPDGSPVVIRELSTWGAVERLIRHMSDRPLDKLTDTYHHAPMWFQRYVEVARASDGTPIERRVYFYEGRIVCSMPKHQAANAALIPEPPEEMLSAFRESRCFRAVDLALDINGRWWVLRSQAGEQAAVPAGGRAEEFYTRLADEILRGPDMPLWCWCLVANVVKQHALGETHTSVEGSRHFAAGAKVVFAGAYWDSGGERCTVLSVPKYTDELIGVTLKSGLLENFRCEKTTDKAVIRALATNRLREPFERERKTSLRCGFDLWGQTEDVRKHIEIEAEYLNGWLGSMRNQQENS